MGSIFKATPLLLLLHRSSSTAPISLLHSHLTILSPRRRLSSLASMAGQSSTAVETSAEHKVGDWFSVPELRLRGHYFNVPLDYNNSSGRKITVFAREVVAGIFFSFSLFIL